MKKVLVWLLLTLLLAGCARQEDFETMADVYPQPEVTPAQPVSLILPPDAAVTAVETGEGNGLYLCDGYTVTVQTLPGGDLQQTLRTVTGYDRDQLPVMSRKQGQLLRHECVWTCAGEGGDQVGRTLVLDAGLWHYTLTVMANAADAGRLTDTWREIMDSFQIGLREQEKQ